MRKPPQPNHLYSSRKASVTPSWVRFGGTSIAVRSIVRLRFKKIQSPAVARFSLLFVSLSLTYFSAMHLYKATLPAWLAVGLLAASVLLTAISLWLAVLRRTLYQITVSLFDGTDEKSQWRQEATARELHDAIMRAMDWHRADYGSSDTDLIQNVAARRKTANSWSRTA